MEIETLAPGAIKQLLSENDYIEGPLRAKMVESKQDEYLKFFYDQPGIHWSRLRPKAKLFCDNANKLSLANINAPVITRLAHCEEEGAWLVTYKKIPGDDLRAINDPGLLAGLPQLMARLHRHGIYFRGIHLGNVLALDQCADQCNGPYALIDIAGMRIWPMPLTIWQRLRNIGRFLSFPEDVALFSAYGIEKFCDEYCAAAGLTGWRKAWLKQAVVARVAQALGEH